MSKNGAAAVKVGNLGDVRSEDLREWQVVMAGGQSFLGRPTEDVDEDGRLYAPCYVHSIQVQPSGQGMSVARGASIFLFLVGIRSARLRPAAVLDLVELPDFELEELARCVNAAEAERRQLRQQKSGVVVPTIIPPTGIRG